MAGDVFNLTHDDQTFMCAGYTFQRVEGYDGVVGELFQRGTVTRSISAGPQGVSYGGWRMGRPQREGRMAITYSARWSGEGEEPSSVIYRDATRLFDLLLLWAMWGGELACTGVRLPLEKPSLFCDPFYRTKRELVAEIDRILPGIDRTTVERLGLNPGLFLLLESYRTELINFQTLFLSPAIDLLASKQTLPAMREEDERRLAAVKASLGAALELHRPGEEENDRLWRNVLGPFSGTIEALGRPAAADKLREFMAKSPALRNLPMAPEIIESHARAFNQFRNATLHYGGLPREVKLNFAKRSSVKIKREPSRDSMLRAMAYYTQAFQDFLMLHMARELGAASAWGESRYEHTLQEFFEIGHYNGHDWVAGAFLDEIEQS